MKLVLLNLNIVIQLEWKRHHVNRASQLIDQVSLDMQVWAVLVIRSLFDELGDGSGALKLIDERFDGLIG